MSRFFALALLAAAGCLRYFPEANVPHGESVTEVLTAVETAAGARFLEPPTQAPSSADERIEARAAALSVRPAGGSGAIDEALYSLFRAIDEDAPPAARAMSPPWAADAAVYDASRLRVLVPARDLPLDVEPERAATGGGDPAEADSPGPDPDAGSPEAFDAHDARMEAPDDEGGHPDAGDARVDEEPREHGPLERSDRQLDLARLRALSAALAHQHVGVAGEDLASARARDRNDALLSVVEGAALVLAIEASLAPIHAFDASMAPVRRKIERLYSELMVDPSAAAAALSDPHLPEVLAMAVREALEHQGAARRRYVLRVFGGARLVLRAWDRVARSGMARVLADPPESTEQILHPERYLDGDETPVTVSAPRRAGLLGFDMRLRESGPAGEFGLLLALDGVLAPGEAARAADGWAGDLLTLYRSEAGEGSGLAWHLVFDTRGDAHEAASSLARAMVFRFGGELVEGPGDDEAFLIGADRPGRVRRVARSVALVLGGDESFHARAIEALLAEPCEHPGGEDTYDRNARLLRAAASPFFYDEPGRFDSLLRSLYGFLFRHRLWPGAGAHAALNPNGFPVLGWFLPDEAEGLLFAAERGPDRRDTRFFLGAVRSHRSEAYGVGRFWSPPVSWTGGGDYFSLSILHGLLWEQEDGYGRRERSPRLFWSRESGLDGAERSLGILADSVNAKTRDDRDFRVGLLPGGVLAQFTRTRDPIGFDLGVVGDGVLLRRREAVSGAPLLEFSALWGAGLRFLDDDASGTSEFSVLGGLGLRVRREPRRFSAGLLSIGGRHALGFGSERGRGFFDFLFLRAGG